MVIEKGMISPELAEAVLGAIAPNIINASRAAQQSQSVAPIPPEVAQMLQGGQPPAGAPGEPPAAPPNLAEPEAAPTPEGVLEPQTEEKMPPPPGSTN
jgi:hypothetical protein